MTPDQIERLRDDTPGCTRRIHLNNAGSGLMPTPVLAAITDHLTLESEIGGYEAEELRSTGIQAARGSVARLVGSRPRNIAFTESATGSYARALSSIPFEDGDLVVTTTNDYISNQIMFLSLARRSGLRIVRLANEPSGLVDLNDLRRLLRDESPRLVAVTHVPTNSGLIQPIEAIGELCREADTIYLVDACQSVGQLPIDVERIGCDFLSATSRKFLRGPRGFGFLDVSDRILDRGLEPLYLDMRGARWTEADRYLPQADARRFENWELPYALLLGTGVAAEYALALGLVRIERRLVDLADGLRERLGGCGLQTLDRGPRRAAIVTVAIPDREPAAFHAALSDAGVNSTVSLREYANIDFDEKQVPWALRLSPHYYNTEEEVERTIGIVAALAGVAS